jgi:hypothetical protein
MEFVTAKIVFAMLWAFAELWVIVLVVPVNASGLPPRKKLPLPVEKVRLLSSNGLAIF